MRVDTIEFSGDISEILNVQTPKNTNFYVFALKNASKYIKSDLCGVYFLDALNLSKKGLIYEGEVVEGEADIFKENILDIMRTQKESAFYVPSKKIFKTPYAFKLAKNTLFCKLHIKNSFFGFFFFNGTQEYSEEQIALTKAICDIYSYLIKDQELSGVFKFQLNALQDALAEKEEAHRVIERQHKKLLEYDKTKNNFLANISHELRTPLNAILGFSQALDCKIFGELNAKQAEYVKDIHTSGLHLLNMINELLDLAKMESKVARLNLSEISPECAIREVVNILTPLAEKKSIKMVFENSCPSNITADYQKFQQILYNLLSNAIKFTQKKGKVTIRSACKNKKYILEVQDNGIGIEPKYHKKIFVKYVHLNNIYTKDEASTGLGLAITKELVRLHKGKIILASEPNKGSTFRVELNGAIV